MTTYQEINELENRKSNKSNCIWGCHENIDVLLFVRNALQGMTQVHLIKVSMLGSCHSLLFKTNNAHSFFS